MTPQLATQIIKNGYNAEKHYGMANIPSYQTSTIVFPSVADYLAAREGVNIYVDQTNEPFVKDLAYGTSFSPTVQALEDAIKNLDQAKYCLLASSGLQAIALVFNCFLNKGDSLLVTDCLYPNTRKYCEQVLIPNGIEVVYYDPTNINDIIAKIQAKPKMLFIENPGSHTFELMDVALVCKKAKEHDVISVIDNSWATPLYFQPFEHGVDLSIQAISKYINGHSDVLMGSITTCSDDYYEKLYQFKFLNGTCVNSFDCSLVLRGLKTLDVRLARHRENVDAVIDYLSSEQKVSQIYFPAYKGFKQYNLWKRDFLGATSLLSFGIKGYSRSDSHRFIDALQLFDVGASWGGCQSLSVPFELSKIRKITKFDDEQQFIRLHIGLENIDDLINDLKQAFIKL